MRKRKGRSQVVGELARAREEIGKQQALLGEREKQAQTYHQQIQAKDEQAQKLQQQQAEMQQQYSVAQANLQTLNQQLQNSAAEAVLSKDKLAALEAELKKKSRTRVPCSNSLPSSPKATRRS